MAELKSKFSGAAACSTCQRVEWLEWLSREWLQDALLDISTDNAVDTHPSVFMPPRAPHVATMKPLGKVFALSFAESAMKPDTLVL